MASALKKRIASLEPDLIHIHWAVPDLFVLPELKKLGVPVVNTLHGHGFYETLNRNWLRPFLERGLTESDYTFTVGKQLLTDLHKNFPSTKNKSEFLPNGIDEHTFTIGDKLKMQQALNWDLTKKHILCVAHIAGEKGSDLIVEALNGLRNKAGVQLHLIGRALDKEMTQAIIVKIENQTDSNIIYHGPIAHSDLPVYYQAADLCVLPSRIEGFGVALVEAGMSGTPIISTKSGGPQDIVTQENGILVEADSAPALIKGLEQMLANLGQYEPERVRQSMTSRFSRHRIAEQLYAHYKGLFK